MTQDEEIQTPQEEKEETCRNLHEQLVIVTNIVRDVAAKIDEIAESIDEMESVICHDKPGHDDYSFPSEEE